MTQMDISIPLDDDLKEGFESLLYEFGYSAAAVFGALVETSVNTQRFPAELHIEQDPFYSKENMERLLKSIERLEAGQGTYHELIEVDDEETQSLFKKIFPDIGAGISTKRIELYTKS